MYTFIKQFGLMLLVLVGWASTALADPLTGWMGFRNQTGNTLIIRETFANGRLGVPQKIFDNETYRDTPTSGGQRKFSICNAKEPDKILHVGLFPCSTQREHMLFILKNDGKGGLLIENVKLPLLPLPPTKKR